MPKKKLSDIVFQRISPPDTQDTLTMEDLAHVLVKRLGLKRKESRAQHARLLLELMKHKKDNIPLTIEKISQTLAVSQSQTYEEIRKWRTLGFVEFVKMPAGEGFVKGYMLTGNTVNRLLDRAESATKSFFRKTRRIAKDFDDLLMLETARQGKPIKDDLKEEENKAESTGTPEDVEEN
jgi:predicted transcriptional regulator